ncbi:unnamed protein product [Rotaria sp. Silwood2]|nr:unnamed protein product [Rotaria sp. Silwood2]CAF3271038.1 unnamed protein product [Rotaria sp. Silwood2]CAF3414081.1 unnamed protein product [Rotaria sp. Silwood2]CAF4097337.1 unnamed protein product [Rotaria sp. Silwood2]CAF4263587.1 unnamed protein product [Rotaria sp. Silwood2]
MVILFIYVLLLVLPSSVSASSSITFSSVIVTQVQDALAPRESSNDYVITSKKSYEGFFVDSGFTNSTTTQIISIYQQQIRSNSKPPKFVFITHGHPDHLAGLSLIKKIYPTTPIYVTTEQVAGEALKWMNFTCTNGFISIDQCNIDFKRVLRVLTSPRTQLTFNDTSVELSALNVLVKGESSYAGFLGISTSSKDYLLFTGDAITIRSHLWVSNFFDTNQLPSSDDALCAWTGNMKTSVCDLQLAGRKATIFPGHGPISGPLNYTKDISRNIAWLRTLRNLTFNSCNTTYVWSQMIRLYPDFGEKHLAASGGLTTHIPADANSVNCNCINDSPTICPVYKAPPTCPYLDINESDTTLACDIRYT